MERTKPIIIEKKPRSFQLYFVRENQNCISVERLATHCEEVQKGYYRLIVPLKRVENKEIILIAGTRRTKSGRYKKVIWIYSPLSIENFDNGGNLILQVKPRPLEENEFYRWVKNENLRIIGWPWPKSIPEEFRGLFENSYNKIRHLKVD